MRVELRVTLIAALAVRDASVSTESIRHATGESEKEVGGTPVWTPLVAVSLLIWFVLAMHCMSTVAIVRRKTCGWAWPVFMILYMNGLAYVVCLAVFSSARSFFKLKSDRICLWVKSVFQLR